MALLSLSTVIAPVEFVEPVPGRHRRAESDLRGQGDAIVRQAATHCDGHDISAGGLPARVARGDRRLAADTPGTGLGPPSCGGMGGDGVPLVGRLPHGTPEFRLTFYVGPNARRRWAWVTPGSLTGTIAFLAFCILFRLYVQNFGSYNKSLGALGGVMVLLFWFWVVALVLLAAAEMDRELEAASSIDRPPVG